MEIPWTHIIWLTVAVSVYLFGIWEGRGQGYKKRKAEEEQEKKDNPPVPPPAAKPVTVTVDDPGLMRIKNDHGMLTLDLDGTRVNTTALSVDQRKRLIEMLNVIRPWLEGKPAPAPTPAPAMTQAPAPVAPPLSQPKPAPLPPSPSVPRASAPTPTTPKEGPPPATGIVGQIDMILQARLHGTPLGERGIFLSNSPEGGVIVNVGLQKFNGIDEVTDPEIKAALRGAITEWENKYTPGL